MLETSDASDLERMLTLSLVGFCAADNAEDEL